ncbi:DUF4065 domain-containing protein [Sutcliffiella horikoshii]|uniref:Panacea domain-containing protein n=1 Tax=Sutcliffiella horikoshii TaxID=79883 RepID=UPI002041851F|nr:type II toxin-antitoxin system antitoxin SocA domain-containing protein [Sutcliffiella horikoshii]MCM3616664.1 DUF4065 domain-containing protein [Sutcliffiella horikoshii]
MVKDILDISAALKKMYHSIYETTADFTEMKLHKMLYFAQKTHYMHFGEWLFNEDFEGWIHGPVNRKVRDAFVILPYNAITELTEKEEFTLREVTFEYGKYTAWELREMSHEEDAYKKSRVGLREDENGSEVINKQSIISDIRDNDYEDWNCEVH